MAECQCAYCEEWFGSTRAFDRHLRVRRETVVTPRGYVVPNEEVVTCRPMSEFDKRGLHPTEHHGKRVWRQEASPAMQRIGSTPLEPRKGIGVAEGASRPSGGGDG